MKMISQRNNRGFTLVELLVVIGIIAILASIVLISVSEVRKKARDKVRQSDVSSALLALKLHHELNKTYVVSGSGYLGNGQGWFNNRNGGTYPDSVARLLYQEGVAPTAISDPLIPDGSYYSGSQRSYMIYEVQPGGMTVGVCVFAMMEAPTADHSASFALANARLSSGAETQVTSNGMNYGECI